MDTTLPSLLERVASDPNREAWQQFVDLYTPLLFGWTLRRVLAEHDSADLGPDIFAVRGEQLPASRADPPQSIRAWQRWGAASASGGDRAVGDYDDRPSRVRPNLTTAPAGRTRSSARRRSTARRWSAGRGR